MWLWPLKMPTQNLLRLLLLLILMLRNMLMAVGADLVIRLNFCSHFDNKVWFRFCSWDSGDILKLKFCQLFVIFLVFFWPCLYVFWNGIHSEIHTRKRQFSSSYWYPQFLLLLLLPSRWSFARGRTLILTVTETALKMHFWDPSQWDKMCFECQRIKFRWKKR